MKIIPTSWGKHKPQELQMRPANYTMELPSGGSLQAIYISGQRQIFGIIGSDADIQLAGTHLILNDFSFFAKAPIILEFSDKIYHYVITNDYVQSSAFFSNYGQNSVSKTDVIGLKLIAVIDK